MAFDYFSVVRHGDRTTVLTLAACRLGDDAVASAMANEVTAYVNTHEPKTLIVDFSSVDLFRDIVAAGLVSVIRQMRSSGGEVILTGMNQEVRECFRVTNLDQVFRIHDSVRDAIREAQE